MPKYMYELTRTTTETIQVVIESDSKKQSDKFISDHLDEDDKTFPFDNEILADVDIDFDYEINQESCLDDYSFNEKEYTYIDSINASYFKINK